MIHLLQCVCPKRHAILAIFYDDTFVTAEEAMLGFKEMVAQALNQNLIKAGCAICHKPVVFHYEDGKTAFETMEQAHEAGKQSEADQLATRRYLDAQRN